MRTLWIVVAAFVVALALGCGKGGDNGGDNGGADTAEGAAKQMLTAMKKGDIDALLGCADIKAMYDQLPEEGRGGKSFDEWKKELREQTEASLTTDFDFEVTGSEAVGDVTLVKVKFTPAGGEAEELDIPFKKVGGQWRATPEGLAQIMLTGM